MVILIVRGASDEALTAAARGLASRSLLVCLLFAVMFALGVVGLDGAGGFLAVQRAGWVTLGARLFERFKKLQALAAAESLGRTLQSFYRSQWRRDALSVSFHRLGWFMGGVET